MSASNVTTIVLGPNQSAKLAAAAPEFSSAFIVHPCGITTATAAAAVATGKSRAVKRREVSGNG